MVRRFRLLPFAYLLALSAVVALLALVGFVLERLPLVPASVSRAYGAGLVGLAAALTAPLDPWVAGGADPPTTEPPRRSGRRHN